MLHGIGGRTISEAKRNLTWTEAQRHFAYIAKRGSLNVGERIEQGFAMLAWLIVMTHEPVPQMRQIKKQDGSNFTIADFMPHGDHKGRKSAVDNKLLRWAKGGGG